MRQQNKRQRFASYLWLSAVIFLFLTACQAALAPSQHNTTALATDATPVVTLDESYIVGVGDKIKLSVFQEDDISGEYVVDETGELQLPLIGRIMTQGKTLHSLTKTLTSAYANGYLRNPRLSLELAEARPFFIIGEVFQPGRYPYEAGLTVARAIAQAGGMTYRANRLDITVKRDINTNNTQDNNTTRTVPIDFHAPILPGDVLEVHERFF